VKAQPGWEPPDTALGVSDYPIKVAELSAAAAPKAAASGPAVTPALRQPGKPASRISHQPLDPERARQALTDMLAIDGLLGCAVVDATTGLVLSQETREDQPVDFDLCAAASAQVLRAHRLAARNMGMTGHIEEVMVSAGQRQHVLRTIGRHPELFLMALLDKHRANLALARYKLMEIEKGLL
jgi:predicted regulator of Ras-like GTPase activity (Roadblock/LC7/MglB family)